MRVIVWNINKCGKDWQTQHVQSTKEEVVTEIIKNDKDIYAIERLMEIDNWDYLLVFEENCRE